MRRVYLQTLHDGSWTTPKDVAGSLFEFDLTHATLRLLKASPVNARLVCVKTGQPIVSKLTVDQFTFAQLDRVPPRVAPRPVIRTKPGIPARVGRFDRSNKLGSCAQIVRA